MDKVWRKGVPFDPAVAPLVARMALVDEYRETLLRLQGTWDTLALLGQMSGTMAEMAQTRKSFEALSHVLLDSLARQQLRDVTHKLQGTAQVAIDVLVRNLFERTADVGFLCTDAEVRELAAHPADADRSALEARFAAYAAKYSVYDDVVVLDPTGEVLARLDTQVACSRCTEPWVQEALVPGMPYIERFGQTALLDGRRGLLYAAAISGAGGRATGVLCLSFRFDDEMVRLFERLSHPGDGTVVVLLDGQGRVTASSDPWQVPVGLPVPPVRAGECLLRLAGRDYVAARMPATGFQGYGGPGWDGLALVAADIAFADHLPASTCSHLALAPALDTQGMFDEELSGIPLQAEGIQRTLALSVWNGKLRLNQCDGGEVSNGLAAALLKEVSVTGDRIRLVFRDAISRLHATALSSILAHARFQAGLAIEIVDRNLYERANDCRWWALNEALQRALTDPSQVAHASDVLAGINQLYTVYTLLVLFDARGCVVAVSNTARADLVGQALDSDLVRATLALPNPQAYHVTPHAPSVLSGGGPTLVYSAALDGGGVAIVFDGAAQFSAMLRDALPREPGAIGLLLDRRGHVVASTDPRFTVGGDAQMPATLLQLARGATGQEVIEFGGAFYAVGVAHSSGYREYRSSGERRADDLMVAMLMRLGDRQAPAMADTPDAARFELRPCTDLAAASATTDIASFAVEGGWYGLPAEDVVEALLGRHVTPLPNGRPHVLGLVRWHDEMIAVMDLAAWQSGGAAARRDGPLLVCRASGGRHIAVRVDALGDVSAVPVLSLKAWKSPLNGAPLQLLSGSVGGHPTMLTVLGVAGLLAAVNDAAPVNPVAAPTPTLPVMA